MSLYSVVLFVHVLGAIGLFVALGIERLVLSKLKGAQSGTQKEEWIQVMGYLPKIGGSSLMLILFSGFYLTAVSWREAPWIGPSFGALILIGVIGATLSRSAMKTMNLHRLWISAQLRVGLGLGILFLMTTKPDLFVSLLVLALALVLAFLSTLLTSNERRSGRAFS